MLQVVDIYWGIIRKHIRITRPCDLYPPCTPLLYCKTGVYRDIHNFLSFVLNQCTHDLLQKLKKQTKKHHNFSSGKYNFYDREELQYIT